MTEPVHGGCTRPDTRDFASNNSSLLDSQLQTFKSRGYILIEDFIKPDHVAQVHACISQLVSACSLQHHPAWSHYQARLQNNKTAPQGMCGHASGPGTIATTASTHNDGLHDPPTPPTQQCGSGAGAAPSMAFSDTCTSTSFEADMARYYDNSGTRVDFFFEETLGEQDLQAICHAHASQAEGTGVGLSYQNTSCQSQSGPAGPGAHSRQPMQTASHQHSPGVPQWSSGGGNGSTTTTTDTSNSPPFKIPATTTSTSTTTTTTIGPEGPSKDAHQHWTAYIGKLGHGLHLHPSVLQQLCFHPHLLALLRQLSFQAPSVVQSMVIAKQPHIGAAVPPHQDATFLYTEPPTGLLGFWLALEDCDPENACLSFVPGSHLQGVTRRFMASNSSADDGFWGGQFLGEEHKYGEEGYVAVPMKAGSLLVIDSRVVHKSEQNSSGRTRLAFTWHVHDEVGAAWSADNWLQPSSTLRLYG